MAGLLAAEEQRFASQRLEHVAVADVGDDDADPALLHQAVEAEVRHLRDGDSVDSEVEGEDREDLVAVDRLAPLVDGKHPVAVAVERDPEVEALLTHDPREERQIGRSTPDVDVVAVGVVPDRRHLGAELLEGLWCNARVGAVRAVDRDAEAAQVGAELLEHVLEVAVRRDPDAVDGAPSRGRCVEQRLDLLLCGIGQLAAGAVEELDAVVLRRVVRRGDHGAEVEP